jgi:acetyl esterase/lipase
VFVSARPLTGGTLLKVLLVLLVIGGFSRASRAPPPTSGPEWMTYADGVYAQVHRPDRAVGAPTVVLLHGCCGDPADLTQLALALADRGALVVNAGWTTLENGGGWPRSYREATCAVAVARLLARDLGARDDLVTLVAWSDGALLGSVAALAPPPVAPGCLAGNGVRPDAIVALAGFFGGRPEGPLAASDDRAANAWFGGEPESQAGSWRAGNPLALLADGVTSPASFDLVVGRDDALASDAHRFVRALRDAGVAVRLHEVPGGHPDVILPRTAAGAAAVDRVIARAGGQ